MTTTRPATKPFADDAAFDRFITEAINADHERPGPTRNDLVWPYIEGGLEAVAEYAARRVKEHATDVAEYLANGNVRVASRYTPAIAAWQRVLEVTLARLTELVK